MGGGPVLLTFEDVREIHADMLARYGGDPGEYEGRLDSALGSVLNVYYYESMELFDLAAAYAFYIGKGHPFLAGNKRTASVAVLLFLDLNDATVLFPPKRLERAIMAVARGRMDRRGFAKLLARVAAETAEPEED